MFPEEGPTVGLRHASAPAASSIRSMVANFLDWVHRGTGLIRMRRESDLAGAVSSRLSLCCVLALLVDHFSSTHSRLEAKCSFVTSDYTSKVVPQPFLVPLYTERECLDDDVCSGLRTQAVPVHSPA